MAVAPNLLRIAGHDAWSNLDYVRLLLRSEPTQAAPELQGPTLTGQCTREPGGKLHFELFASFGEVSDPTFYPPWHSSGGQDLFAPPTTKVSVTLEFLGYTRVKPVRRTFEQTLAPGPAQLRYLNPGAGSPNLEPPAAYFPYLRSLPTLRLTALGHTAEFGVTEWLRALHAEPLCAASGA